MLIMVARWLWQKKNVEAHVKQVDVQKDVVAHIEPSNVPVHDEQQTNITLRAYDLPKMDHIGKCDPYYVLKLDHHEIHNGRKESQSNTLDAAWVITVAKKVLVESEIFCIEIYDKDNTKDTDDYIGKFEMPTKVFMEKEAWEGVKLHGDKAKNGKLDITYLHKSFVKDFSN